MVKHIVFNPSVDDHRKLPDLYGVINDPIWDRGVVPAIDFVLKNADPDTLRALVVWLIYPDRTRMLASHPGIPSDEGSPMYQLAYYLSESDWTRLIDLVPSNWLAIEIMHASRQVWLSEGEVRRYARYAIHKLALAAIQAQSFPESDLFTIAGRVPLFTWGYRDHWVIDGIETFLFTLLKVARRSVHWGDLGDALFANIIWTTSKLKNVDPTSDPRLLEVAFGLVQFICWLPPGEVELAYAIYNNATTDWGLFASFIAILSTPASVDLAIGIDEMLVLMGAGGEDLRHDFASAILAAYSGVELDTETITKLEKLLSRLLPAVGNGYVYDIIFAKLEEVKAKRIERRRQIRAEKKKLSLLIAD